MKPRDFNAAANEQAAWRREARPPAAELAKKGIKTRESLDWLAAQHPMPPHLTHEIDQADVRADAIEAARAERRDAVNALRREFRARPEKARRDFGTARDYRGQDRDR